MGAGAASKATTRAAYAAPDPGPGPGPQPAATTEVVTKASKPLRESLELVFRDEQGAEHRISYSKKPLGFEITMGKVPVVIRGCHRGGWSERLGVQPGWELTAIDGSELVGRGWQSIIQVLMKSVEELAQDFSAPQHKDNVELVFETGTGPRTLVFWKRPLGLEFNTSAPICISGVARGSAAERLGVQVNWEVRQVNGKDVSGMTFDEQFGLLKRLSARLPDNYASIAPHAGLTIHNDPPAGTPDEGSATGGEL